MTINDFWTMWGAIGTTLLAGIGWFQINDINAQTQKDRTMNAVLRYDTDPLLDRDCSLLAPAVVSGVLKHDPRPYKLSVVNLLNYLDAVAIGIEQGLYHEPTARSFLADILLQHCDDLLTEDILEKLDLSLDQYTRLAHLRRAWELPRSFFRGELG